jgi:NADH-quinone oxidoreductase subunit C
METSEHITKAVAALKASFALQEEVVCGQTWLIIDPANLVEVVKKLRDQFEFDFLSSATASDYYPQMSPRFHVVYQFYANRYNVRLGLRVPIEGLNPSLPTLEGLYPVANWHEREMYDMFGIYFTGHSDLRRILMPHDWEGHPLRKDYPVGYEEPQFTFNFDDIQQRKHRARYEEA